MVQQFLFSRKIDNINYSLTIPCKDWADAFDLAEKTGMKAEGSNVHTIPCVPIFQFMSFCQSLIEGNEEYNFKWKPYAEEQIEAFLSAGWPEEPHEMIE